jgi:hypothetical protein
VDIVIDRLMCFIQNNSPQLAWNKLNLKCTRSYHLQAGNCIHHPYRINLYSQVINVVDKTNIFLTFQGIQSAHVNLILHENRKWFNIGILQLVCIKTPDTMGFRRWVWVLKVQLSKAGRQHKLDLWWPWAWVSLSHYWCLGSFGFYDLF